MRGGVMDTTTTATAAAAAVEAARQWVARCDGRVMCQWRSGGGDGVTWVATGPVDPMGPRDVMVSVHDADTNAVLDRVWIPAAMPSATIRVKRGQWTTDVCGEVQVGGRVRRSVILLDRDASPEDIMAARRRMARRLVDLVEEGVGR